MSDRLALAHAIEEAGIERTKAENIASVVIRLVEGAVATKADLQAQGAELKAKIVTVRTDIAELKADNSAVRAELRNLETRVAREIGRVADRTLIRLSGVLVVLSGIIIAVLHYWQPHG